MTSNSTNSETARGAELTDILPKLDPADIDVDSLGRIVVRSSEVRAALLRVAAARPEEVAVKAVPANGSQCGCTNHSNCLPLLR